MSTKSLSVQGCPFFLFLAGRQPQFCFRLQARHFSAPSQTWPARPLHWATLPLGMAKNKHREVEPGSSQLLKQFWKGLLGKCPPQIYNKTWMLGALQHPHCLPNIVRWGQLKTMRQPMKHIHHHMASPIVPHTLHHMQSKIVCSISTFFCAIGVETEFNHRKLPVPSQSVSSIHLFLYSIWYQSVFNCTRLGVQYRITRPSRTILCPIWIQYGCNNLCKHKCAW